MRLPHVTDIADVDVAVVGVPMDGAVSFRTGARFGPEAIRSLSVLTRPYSPTLEIDVFEHLSVVDYGDAPTVPGYVEETLDRVTDCLGRIHGAGAMPLCLGGDHSMILAELRAAARVHGPVSLVQFDAHADVWNEYYGARYFHGTVIRRAIEEGLIDPTRSIQAGLRGTLYSADDADEPQRLGLLSLTWQQMRDLSPAEFGDLVRDRVEGGPTFLSFDVDFVDPAFAPGTGTPEVGGPTSSEALDYLTSVAGLKLCALDCVELSPPYDQADITAALAATVTHQMLALSALGRAGWPPAKHLDQAVPGSLPAGAGEMP